MIDWLNKYLRGADGAKPILVRLTRATVEVAALAGLSFLAHNLADMTPEAWGFFIPAVVGGIGIVEGIADQVLDPSQNRRQ